MTTITLRVRNAPGFRINADRLLPAALVALSADEIARLVLPASNESRAVGDVFDVSRSDDETDPALVIEGDVHWLDRLGAKMTQGCIDVQGSAGDYTGFQMAGGMLRIDGDAGHFTGCQMKGGRLTLGGNAGDFTAGALPGDMEGMTGGTLTVHGNAGARLCDRMRRGLVLVGGDAGECAASRLVAGTIGIAGKTGANLGYGMRRGTVLLAQAPERIPPTFTDGGRGFDVFWRLLTRSLATELAPFSGFRADTLPRRYAGDLAVDGRGEVLIVES
ncbi:formylmethanofuran dehydrogenase subunit C [Burkholderia sp. Leaf177]|uniref:formylmethanofuran dehydrogenase subunit C n=1 Tax=Burkholderia sp. Leaf177 TaxID=1736287 RepID=UPI0006FAFDF0|nr:formylmethanofuran dehydrogenase subunit C [Burkholderia sp. Leaf177]KQR76487.1 formylmethanofuran dehydrogenase subunit C [Burkholderia sp. Leaf177]